MNSNTVLDRITIHHGDIIGILNNNFRWEFQKHKVRRSISKMLRRSLEKSANLSQLKTNNLSRLDQTQSKGMVDICTEYMYLI